MAFSLSAGTPNSFYIARDMPRTEYEGFFFQPNAFNNLQDSWEAFSFHSIRFTASVGHYLYIAEKKIYHCWLLLLAVGGNVFVELRYGFRMLGCIT
jgi:hypothetical protein